MKYIKTEDGIYEVVEDRKDGLWVVVKEHKPNNYNFKISLQRIIKQADTIEELCDAFVSVDKDNNRICHLWSELDRLLVFERGHDTYFYGAIWTDKGLIYVAKMNDKGELELL